MSAVRGAWLRKCQRSGGRGLDKASGQGGLGLDKVTGQGGAAVADSQAPLTVAFPCLGKSPPAETVERRALWCPAPWCRFCPDRWAYPGRGSCRSQAGHGPCPRRKRRNVKLCGVQHSGVGSVLRNGRSLGRGGCCSQVWHSPSREQDVEIGDAWLPGVCSAPRQHPREAANVVRSPPAEFDQHESPLLLRVWLVLLLMLRWQLRSWRHAKRLPLAKRRALWYLGPWCLLCAAVCCLLAQSAALPVSAVRDRV